MKARLAAAESNLPSFKFFLDQALHFLALTSPLLIFTETVSELKGKLVECEKSVRTLAAVNKELESKVDDIEGKLHNFAALQDECKQLKHSLTGLESKDVGKSKEIDSLKKKNVDLLVEYKECMGKFEALEKSVLEKQGSIDQYVLGECLFGRKYVEISWLQVFVNFQKLKILLQEL